MIDFAHTTFANRSIPPTIIHRGPDANLSGRLNNLKSVDHHVPDCGFLTKFNNDIRPVGTGFSFKFST